MSLIKRHGRGAAVVAILTLAACGGSSENTMGQSDITELIASDVKAGNGAEATPGTRVTVHYTGWVYDGSRDDRKGQQFDSSRARDQFSFQLGAGAVIPGWDQGVAGMRVGGQRTLTIPPALGYGATGAGGGVIPPNATLVFDVELLAVN
jgi:FKBP-type peptidyl-prolyl cis-trans isomerase FkpA